MEAREAVVTPTTVRRRIACQDEPVGNGENVPALEFAGLFKRFGDNVAVDHIDLAVPAGSFFGLVGPNGAGKTTALSMAVGLLRPDGGTVRIFGRDVWADPVAAKALIGVLLMISFLAGVLATVIPALSGNTSGLPFGGLLFTVIAAASFTNFYGDDGTSLWLTLVTPGAARADVRGRVWAWFLVIGPAGLLALIGVRSVNGPAPDGGPGPMRVLKTHIALIALPAVTLLPALALLVAGTATHDLALRWLAVPVGLAWAVFLCRRSVQLAQQRLENYGPEIFARVRAPVG
jgi:energy-coupling factor transporter ATP-binding protein EcfA2